MAPPDRLDIVAFGQDHAHITVACKRALDNQRILSRQGRLWVASRKVR
jgi:hypothetical protein